MENEANRTELQLQKNEIEEEEENEYDELQVTENSSFITHPYLSNWFYWNVASQMTKIPPKKTHLVILVHGLHGRKTDLSSIANLLQSKYENVFCFASECNEGLTITHDGIDRGGIRLAQEITNIVEENSHLSEISFIGHSLGGIYARYCIGELFRIKFFEKLKPKNYISLASPHLGVRRPPTNIYNSTVSFFVKTVLARTGKQLALEDDCPHLLVEISKPDSPHYQGLCLFKKKILYCNIANDLQVPFTTSSILAKNPFKDGQKKLLFSNLKFMNEYNCVLETPIPTSTPNLEETYLRDDKRTYLREMLIHLQKIDWERVGVHFPHFMAHESIIGKRYSQSMVVVNHLVDHFEC